MDGRGLQRPRPHITWGPPFADTGRCTRRGHIGFTTDLARSQWAFRISDDLRVVERFRRVDPDTLQVGYPIERPESVYEDLDRPRSSS